MSDSSLDGTRRALVRLIEVTSGQPSLPQKYREYRERSAPGASFWNEAVRLLGIRLDPERSTLVNIPASGPVIVVANHPFGILDGFLLCWLVSQIRQDFRIMLNGVRCVPEMAAHSIAAASRLHCLPCAAGSSRPRTSAAEGAPAALQRSGSTGPPAAFQAAIPPCR